MTEQQREAFWKKVDKRGPDECWPWISSVMKRNRDSPGYGLFVVGRKMFTATHIPLALDGRPRPTSAHMALHSFDNPLCVNPRHLRWGTREENVQDMIDRGRVGRVRRLTREEHEAIMERITGRSRLMVTESS